MLWVKLRRDLHEAWPQLLMMVSAMAVSLTVFGAVLFAWSVCDRETTGAYARTEPASATLMLEPGVEAARMAVLVAEAVQQPGVLRAAGRAQFDSEVWVDGQLRHVPLQVFVAPPDDPMQMARFEVQGGRWPPAPGEVFVGRDTMGLLDVAPGDTLAVRVGGGERLELHVAGTVYDPSLSPSPQEQRGRAWLSAASLQRPVLDQLKLQVGQAEPSRDRDEIVAVASEVAAWLQRQGLAVREIQVPEPYTHPHQFQAEVLLLSLGMAGGMASLLSGVLVASMLQGLFTQQIPQLGILKAIGARTGQIAALYLAMTALVAAAAALLSLGPALLLGRAAAGWFLGFLGIVPVSLAAPAWTVAVLLGTGLVLPPALAMVPLVRASRTTVRAAIDHRGLTSEWVLPGAALAWLGRLRWLDRGLLLALRNTLRRPARSLLSVGLLACAGTVFVSGVSLGDSVEAMMAQQEERRSWDVDVQLVAPSPPEVGARLEAVPGVLRAEGWRRVQGGLAGPGQIPVTRTWPDQGHGSLWVTAFPRDTVLLPAASRLEGRWLQPAETGAVVINQLVRAKAVPGVQPGDEVQLFVSGRATRWRVAGIAREGHGGGGVYVTAEGLADALGEPPQVSVLRVVTERHDEESREAVAGAVREALLQAGIAVESSASVSRGEAIAEGHFRPVVLIVLSIAVAMGVVGAIGLASTMSANVLERTREIGILHAIGARPGRVRRIVVAEGVLLALASCLLAVLPTLLLTALLDAGLGALILRAPLPYRLSLPAAGLWTAMVLLGAALASEAAATRASRLTVREALAYL
jgi:putative ABC transport system permease protein